MACWCCRAKGQTVAIEVVEESDDGIAQWCMPLRRQHAGTETGAIDGAAVANRGQQTAINANVNLTRIVQRFYSSECLHHFRFQRKWFET